MPRYPGVTWKSSPNHTPGNHGRKAVVLHIAQGGYTSSINYMAANGTSSHFIVSAAGSVSQMVDTDDTAWGNGLAWCTTPAQAATLGAAWQGVGWYCPHKHKVTPTWADITPGVNPNAETISIEHEGMSGTTRPWAQIAATVKLLQWLATQYPTLAPYAPGRTLIRHADIDPTDKAFCPGPAFDLSAIAAEANAPAEAWQRAWARKGVALEHAEWAIPQLYKYHYLTLGACVDAERYTPGGQLSIAVFERGFIYYLRATQRAYLGPALPAGVAL